MMPTETNRSARLEARIAPEALAVVKRAAELQGRSVSDFVVAASLESANRTIEETHIVRLAAQDQAQFAELLLNPPALSPAMKRAREAHARLVTESEVTARFVLEPLMPEHNRAGLPKRRRKPLDRYFQTQVSQDARRRATSCYVARKTAMRAIAGYYTLSAAHVA